MTDPDNKEGHSRPTPDVRELAAALKAAGAAHHEYEQTALSGVFDEQWPMFYAAFVLGRLGDFTRPSQLTEWLKAVPTEGAWADAAANYVSESLSI